MLINLITSDDLVVLSTLANDPFTPPPPPPPSFTPAAANITF